MKRFSLLLAVLAALPMYAQGPNGVTKTIREFLQMSNQDTTLCCVRGVVTVVKSTSGGNFYISDGTGDLYIYGIVDPAHPGRGFRQMDIKQSDTVTLSGRRQVYKTIVEMTSARLVSRSDGPDHNAPVKYDKEASFKGKTGPEADDAFTKWVEAHINRPAGTEDLHGFIEVAYVVGRNGGVQEVQIVKGINPTTNEVVLRVVRSAPKWKPAVLGGQSVRVKKSITVRL